MCLCSRGQDCCRAPAHLKELLVLNSEAFIGRALQGVGGAQVLPGLCGIPAPTRHQLFWRQLCLHTALSGPHTRLQPASCLRSHAAQGHSLYSAATKVAPLSSNLGKDGRQHSAPSPLLLQRGKERKVQPGLVQGAGLLQEAHVIIRSRACRSAAAAAARLAIFSLLLVLISIPCTMNGLCLAACCTHKRAICRLRPAFCSAT